MKWIRFSITLRRCSSCSVKLTGWFFAPLENVKNQMANNSGSARRRSIEDDRNSKRDGESATGTGREVARKENCKYECHLVNGLLPNTPSSAISLRPFPQLSQIYWSSENAGNHWINMCPYTFRCLLCASGYLICIWLDAGTNECDRPAHIRPFFDFELYSEHHTFSKTNGVGSQKNVSNTRKWVGIDWLPCICT